MEGALVRERRARPREGGCEERQKVDVPVRLLSGCASGRVPAMSERDLLNAPKTYALIQALKSQRFDVHPGSGLHTALMEFAHFEATKTAELMVEIQKSRPPMTIRVVTSEEARRLIDTVQSEERMAIKALADALEAVPDYGRADDGLPCWCACREGPHLTKCEAARAALRLAGRL
jgi:hypothetical protein